MFFFARAYLRSFSGYSLIYVLFRISISSKSPLSRFHLLSELFYEIANLPHLSETWLFSVMCAHHFIIHETKVVARGPPTCNFANNNVDANDEITLQAHKFFSYFTTTPQKSSAFADPPRSPPMVGFTYGHPFI